MRVYLLICKLASAVVCNRHVPGFEDVREVYATELGAHKEADKLNSEVGPSSIYFIVREKELIGDSGHAS